MIPSSLLAPFLIFSKSRPSSFELYLIADSPQMFMALILEELKKYGINSIYTFALANFHPQAEGIIRTLSQKGWRPVTKLSSADISFSYNHLHHPALPSFTMTKDGTIWDIRSQKLLFLWKEMNNKEKPSSSLTIASCKRQGPALLPGSSASIYIDGGKKEEFSLRHNFSQSFTTQNGCLTLAVKDGKAWVRDSSCRNKICLFSQPASLAGERIICAPNHFLLEIKGSRFVDTVVG